MMVACLSPLGISHPLIFTPSEVWNSISWNGAPKVAGVSVSLRSIGRVPSLVTSAAKAHGSAPNTRTTTTTLRVMTTRFRIRAHLGGLGFALSELFVWLMNSRCRFDHDRLFHYKDPNGRG